MSTAENQKLPVIIRPNGKPYRPRKLTAGAWADEWHGESGCFVMGTHDIDRARPVAEEECRFAFGVQYAIKPELVWVRNGFQSGERCWVYDAVQGRAAVRFLASDDPEEVSG